MAHWQTAEQISRNLVVGATRLLAYAARGNLPCRMVKGAEALFDAEVASLYFRQRGSAMASAAHAEGHLGVLGVVKLGERSSAPAARRPSARELRAREIRRAAHGDMALPRRTGTLG
jgi:hypothetical protein